MKIKNKKSLIIKGLVILMITVLTTLTYAGASGLYETTDFSMDFNHLYKNANPSSVLGMDMAANRSFMENNLLCISGTEADGTGAGPYNAKHTVYGIVDINKDGPNTVTLYKWRNGSTSKTEISKEKKSQDIIWFNGMAMAVTNHNESAFTGIMMDHLYGYFYNLLGYSPIPSTSWSPQGLVPYEKHGKDVLENALDGTFSVSKDFEPSDTNCEYVSADTENVYVGPFRYSYKSKVNFGEIKISGKNDKESVYNEKIENIDKTRLFVKDGSQYKGVDYVNPETPFFIKVNKAIDNASNISLNVKAKDVTYYKARIAILRSTGSVATQNYVVYGGDGEPSQPGAPIEYQFENNKGNLEIHKSGIYTSKDVNKVENIGFRIYYLENGSKQYLKLQTDTQPVDGKLIGTIKVNKQDATSNADEATVIYTDQSGDARIERIDSRYEYYLEEVTDKIDYNSEVLTVTQKLAGEGEATDVSIVEKGIVGPITVKKRSISEVTTVELKDARKTGTLHLVKLDYDKEEKRVSGVKFKVKNTETEQWLKAEGSNGVYNLKNYDNDYNTNKEYYKDNYTSDESQATEFETNSNGELTINGVDIGNYIFKEVYITNNNGKINYGYTEVEQPTNVDNNYVFWSAEQGGEKKSLKDGDININLEAYEKTEQSTVYVYNKKKYLKITGFVWEDIADGKANSYEIYGKDTYAEGDTLVDGINVRLKDKEGNIIKMSTTADGGKYVFEEVPREAIENGTLYVEFEYNGLTYTSVVPLVGDDTKINSKAGEVVEQRKKLNEAFTEITNKDDINNRSQGYSRDGSGNVTGTLTYKNDPDNWQSIFESTTYNNETYEGVNLTANTDVAGYSLKDEFTSGRYAVDETDAFVLESVNLGIVKRSKPYIAISNDIENVKVDVNGYSHTYYYKQRGSAVDNGSAFNVGVKFGRDYVSSYTRAIYPSDVAFSSTESGKEDAKKLKVYVTYATTIRNLSSDLKATVNELANYYDKEYTIVKSWIGDDENNQVTWNSTSKYGGQNYNDGNYIGAYTTSIAGTKINPMQNLVVHIRFQVSDQAILGLLSEKATLGNTSEIYAYSSYYNSAKEGCAIDDIYAGIDEASAPGNAKPGDRATYEADTDGAPSLLLEAKGVRTIEGNVFEDATASELQTAKERKGDGIYNENENTIGGVKVELLTADGNVATIFPSVTDENGNLVVNAKGEKIAAVVETTGNDGYYVFRGIEPDKYYIRYTYANGVTKVFDASGNEVKDINVQDYKSTIIVSETIRKAFDDNNNNLTWYKEKGTRYSDARDDYSQRQNIDNELKEMDGASKININNLNAYSPTLELGVEYETIYTASLGDTYEYKVSDIDFGIVERPRQAVTLDKDITKIMVQLYNGQSFGGDIDIKNKKAPEGMFVTPDGVFITIDNEFIPGTHLDISYALSLTNISEIDYLSEDYYYYGEIKGNAVSFNKATLLDYIDNQLLLQQGQNQWTVIGSAEKMNDKGFEWNLNDAQEKELLKQFSAIVKADPVSSSNQLVPGKTMTTPIVLEKIIDAKDTELTYNNNCEVAKIEKTGGRTYDYKLGNYANILIGGSDTLPEEADEAKAPKVTIIPPTGENNSLIYVVIATTTLVVLATGIIAIRRLLKK